MSVAYTSGRSVCSLSLAGIMGSKPSPGGNGRLSVVSVVCCQVRGSCVRRMTRPPRGILRSVLCPTSVIAKPRMGESTVRNRFEAHLVEPK